MREEKETRKPAEIQRWNEGHKADCPTTVMVDAEGELKEEDKVACSDSCPTVTLSWRRVHHWYAGMVKGTIVNQEDYPISDGKLTHKPQQKQSRGNGEPWIERKVKERRKVLWSGRPKENV